MSSTNRGGQRSEADFYPTPAWPVDRLFEEWRPPAGHWLEPTAGDGAIIRAVGARMTGVTWTACELRPEAEGSLLATPGVTSVKIGNFLAATPEWLGAGRTEEEIRRTVALGNPPFRHAMAVIVRSFDFARTVAMLLRLNFLGTAERNDFFRKFPPDVYVVPDRIPFDGEGADSIEHAWFVWNGLQHRKRGSYCVLNTTPLDERRATTVVLPACEEQRELFEERAP